MMVQKKVSYGFFIVFMTILLNFLVGVLKCEASDQIPDSVFHHYEKQLSQSMRQISEIRFNQILADSLSQDLVSNFMAILKEDGAFDYPFDSIFPIGKVSSPDGKLRIFTWNIVLDDGGYKYYGLLQYREKAKMETQIFVLSDSSALISDPEKASLNPENWFGALYYQIIETKLPETTLYTLFGWDGNNLYTKKKILESLTFTSSGKPKFGKMVFKIDRVKLKRVIFEFSPMVNMFMIYDDKNKTIIFDHLEPSDPVYEGNRAFYGPDFSYDAFEFVDDVWVFKSNYKFDSTPEKVLGKPNDKRTR